ncbi:MAG: HNH endonuclease signature motif containing protein [Candidatus Dadabacteria bacterium]|nr:HNH endonuclease signature motif containing protein [Candidatus Dadabacteria bacterium]
MEIVTIQEAREKALSRYFTGRSCKHGHIAERFTRNNGCVKCAEILRKTPKQRERIKKYRAEWLDRPGVRERLRERNRERSQRPEVREKLAENARQYRQSPENREKCRSFMREYNKRPEVRERAKQWSLKPESKEKKRLHRMQPEVRARDYATTRARQARKRRQTPIWAKKEISKIANLYRRAAELTKETQIPHEIDHIIPLNNPRVSGLHCFSNLQILTATENRSKGNSFFSD